MTKEQLKKNIKFEKQCIAGLKKDRKRYISKPNITHKDIVRRKYDNLIKDHEKWLAEFEEKLKKLK